MCQQVLRSPGTEDPKYPHPFELQVAVQLGDNTFTQTLTATNTGQFKAQVRAGDW